MIKGLQRLLATSSRSNDCEMELRRLQLGELDAAARVHRVAFDERLPWLSGLHTPEDDRRYFQDHLFNKCQIWGAFSAGKLTGIIAFRDGWIDQLYVLPDMQNRGIGGRLLGVAFLAGGHYRLWTFQRNTSARRFYEANGFIAVEETDGTGNEEREPDVLYEWRATR